MVTFDANDTAAGTRHLQRVAQIEAAAEQAAERWGVDCLHEDGRHYVMGDSKPAQWSKQTAEDVAKHMAAQAVHAGPGTFTAVRLVLLSPERTDAQHHEAYEHACAMLKQAFAAYQEWQEDNGDADTFADFARETIPEFETKE